MRKSNLFKIFVVMGLSLVLVANLFTVVFADDEDFDNWLTPDELETSVNGTNNTNTETNASVANNDVIETPSLNTQGTTTSLDNTNEKDENEKNSNVNSLVYAGVEDTSILFVVILIGAVVAGYSFKKVRDYNNI